MFISFSLVLTLDQCLLMPKAGLNTQRTGTSQKPFSWRLYGNRQHLIQFNLQESGKIMRFQLKTQGSTLKIFLKKAKKQVLSSSR